MKPRHTIPGRLSEKRALIGLLQTHTNPVLAEMAGMCGYDFLLLDGEHGVFGESDYLNTLQALAAVDTLAIIRLPRHDVLAVGRYLDMGAGAILVPNVSTAEQARTLARATEYSPSGTRGFAAALHRSTRYGMDLPDHMRAPREGASLFVIIESALGVANVEEIVSVEGVDGVFIGPTDLSADLGCLGDFSRPVYAQAIERIEQSASATGKLLGTAPHPGRSLEALLARGYRLILLGADMPLIREAMVSQVRQAQACL